MTEILLVLEATVIVVVAVLFARVSGRCVPAALRALVLTGAFAALLVLPVATFVLPPLPVPMTPRLAALFEPVPSMVFDADALSVDVESGQTSGAGAVAASPRGDRRPAADASALSVVAVVGLVWLAGVLIIGVRLAIGLWTLRRLRRTGVPWPEGAALARHLLGEGLAARTEIVLQPGIGAPMTYGVMRPVVALPRDAPQWPPSDLRRALIHELEHVRRADWATQVFAQVVCALYWFHPLVWLAGRRLRLAMEQACDDAVVRREEGTAYAHQLVVLARRLSAQPAIGLLGMAAWSDLSQRVDAMLDPHCRRHRVGVPVTAALLASALASGSLIAQLDAASTQSMTRDGASESQPLAFEVVSVRENVSGPQGGSYVVRPDGLSVTNYPLRELIRRVFDIKGSLWPQYLIGTDSTIFEKRFDIQANAGRPVDPQEVAAMLRTVFAERFKMQWRKEVRRVPVYELVVLREGRLGPELRSSPHDCRAIGEAARAEGKLPGEATATVKDSNGELACRTGGPWAPGTWRNKNAGKLSELIRLAEGFAFRPIVDATGLTGNFEWQIEFTPVNGRILEVPSIFAALEQQLGLRLRPSSGDIEVLIIDSIEMPGAN